MSFLMPSQRGANQQLPASAPIHNQPTRSHLPLSSLPGYPLQDMPTPSATAIATPFPPDAPHSPPKFAETRCYWSLLSSNLHFIYLDPVLTSHLEDQADLLIGKSLLNFVHPEEQASARADLSEALEQRAMHGTVTRVRYCRLSRVRRFLGYAGPLPQWSDSDKVALDNHYMAVDIAISWAAEGLVLCFIHAVADLVPADNDEQRKTPWSNWCGTPAMSTEQISLLDQQLRTFCPQPGVLTRVFQILSNPSHPQEYRVLFSWPPDSSHEYSNKPSAKEFSKRASAVQTSTHDSSAKTSCTRRWRIVGTMPSVVGDVESVFIPHGTIMFACHTVQNSARNSTGTSAHPPYAGRAQDGYASHHTHHSYNVSPSPYTLPPVNAPSPPYGHFVSSLPSYSSPPWSSHSDSSPFLNYNRWPQNSSPTHTLNSLPAPCTLRETSYGTQPPGRPSESSNYADTRGPQQGYQPTPSPDLDYAERHRPDNIGLPISSPADIVPPPRHRTSPGSAREPASGRNGNRPVGILRCTSCKATSSPEWRKGPSGKKELCNACGLRYARSRAKKEGHVGATQRRKKERVSTMAAKEEARLGPSSPIAIAGSGTRGNTFESGSFASTSSVGSASGSEVYSHHSPIATDPSPSPPSSALNFVHYSHPPPPPPPHGLRHEGRMPFHLSTSPFHPTPSPLSNPSSQRAFRGSDESAMSSSRLAPYGYVTAPTMASGGNAIAPVSSFEREKADERHLATSSDDKKYERYAMSR